MKERLLKLKALFDKKTKLHFSFLVFLMIIGSFFELVGISAIPAFLQVMASPKVILDWPVIGRLFHLMNVHKEGQIFLVCAWGLIAIYFIQNLFLGGLSYLKSNFAKNRRIELGKRPCLILYVAS